MKSLLDEIKTLPQNIKKLDLSKRKLKWGIWAINSPEGQAIEQLACLEEINLQHNKNDFLAMDISKMKNLKKLNLANNDFGYWYYERPTKLGINWTMSESLEFLDVSSNQLTYFGFKAHQLKNLKCLYVSNNIGKEFMYHAEVQPKFSFILELPFIVSLKEIHLKQNNFKELPPITHLCNLEVVDLAYNKLRRLDKKIEQLSKLKKLSLYANKLMDLPIEAIEKMTNLEILDVRMNAKLDSKMIKKIKGARPELQILV